MDTLVIKNLSLNCSTKSTEWALNTPSPTPSNGGATGIKGSYFLGVDSPSSFCTVFFLSSSTLIIKTLACSAHNCSASS